MNMELSLLWDHVKNTIENKEINSESEVKDIFLPPPHSPTE